MKTLKETVAEQKARLFYEKLGIPTPYDCRTEHYVFMTETQKDYALAEGKLLSNAQGFLFNADRKQIVILRS